MTEPRCHDSGPVPVPFASSGLPVFSGSFRELPFPAQPPDVPRPSLHFRSPPLLRPLTHLFPVSWSALTLSKAACLPRSLPVCQALHVQCLPVARPLLWRGFVFFSLIRFLSLFLLPNLCLFASQPGHLELKAAPLHMPACESLFFGGGVLLPVASSSPVTHLTSS